MRFLSAKLKNQRGSVTMEFIGILPFVFLLLLILWQFLTGVYAVIIAQSAVNEAAKVYAITKNGGEALDAARQIVETAGGGISYNGTGSSVSADGSYFTATVGVHMDLVFLPDFIKRNLNPEDKMISFSRELKGRVVN